MYSSTEQLETVWDCYELTTVNQIRVRQSIQDRSSSLYAPPIQVYLVYQRNVCVVQSCGRAVPERNKNKMWQAVTNSTRGGSIRVFTRNHSRFIGHGIIYSTLVFIYYCVPESVAVCGQLYNARSTTISRERVQDFGPITIYLVSHSVTLDHLVYFMASLWLAEPSTHRDQYPFLLVDQAVVVFFGYNYTMRHLSLV